ncbi:hypothetical protein L9G15_03880 [Shewanella sp. A3A]|nr:hypothetical protein [Shewanella ferrihydritica]
MAAAIIAAIGLKATGFSVFHQDQLSLPVKILGAVYLCWLFLKLTERDLGKAGDVPCSYSPPTAPNAE